jgi:hypothetical protein
MFGKGIVIGAEPRHDSARASRSGSGGDGAGKIDLADSNLACYFFVFGMSEPPPSYELFFEERKGYLYARVTAEIINKEIAMAYLTQVAERAKRFAPKRLMLHRDIPQMLPDGVLFFVTAEFQQMIAGIKTAFVNPHLSNEDAFKFAITVGQNRGADYKIFSSDTDAETWLLRA